MRIERNRDSYKRYMQLNLRSLTLLIRFAVICFTTLFICSANFAYAENFANTSFHLTYTDVEQLRNSQSIRVDFFFSNSDVSEIERILKDGAKIEIAIEAELSEDGFIYDSNIETQEYILLLQFDMLTLDYVLTQFDGKIYRFKSLEELYKTIFYPLSFTYYTPNLENEKIYRVDLGLRLQHTTIPLWIERVLFFWDWDIVHLDYVFDFMFPR